MDSSNSVGESKATLGYERFDYADLRSASSASIKKIQDRLSRRYYRDFIEERLKRLAEEVESCDCSICNSFLLSRGVRRRELASALSRHFIRVSKLSKLKDHSIKEGGRQAKLL